MSSRIEEQARSLLETARRLDPECGLESSLKWSVNSLKWNRFLAGIDANNLPDTAIAELIDELNMPPEITDLVRQSAKPTTYLLGFEADGERIVNKLYFEYWDQFVERTRIAPADKSPFLLNIGYKWQLEPLHPLATTHYYCYPLLSVHQILERMQSLLGESDIFNQIREIIMIAAYQCELPSFVYLEASEVNGRNSFDLNIYQAALPFKAINPYIDAFSRSLSPLTQQDRHLLEAIQETIIGHLSAGIDRNGDLFLTIYYTEA